MKQWSFKTNNFVFVVSFLFLLFLNCMSNTCSIILRKEYIVQPLKKFHFYLFICHEFDGWLWGYLNDIHTIPSPQGLHSPLLQHVLETIDHSIFVLACSMYLCRKPCIYIYIIKPKTVECVPILFSVQIWHSSFKLI